MSEFKSVPFPHVLKAGGTRIQFVTNQDIIEGQYLAEHSHVVIGDDGLPINVNRVWLIRKVHEKRKAKGVWNGETPFYYDADASSQGLKKETQL